MQDDKEYNLSLSELAMVLIKNSHKSSKDDVFRHTSDRLDQLDLFLFARRIPFYEDATNVLIEGNRICVKSKPLIKLAIEYEEPMDELKQNTYRVLLRIFHYKFFSQIHMIGEPVPRYVDDSVSAYVKCLLYILFGLNWTDEYKKELKLLTSDEQKHLVDLHKDEALDGLVILDEHDVLYDMFVS